MANNALRSPTIPQRGSGSLLPSSIKKPLQVRSQPRGIGTNQLVRANGDGFWALGRIAERHTRNAKDRGLFRYSSGIGYDCEGISNQGHELQVSEWLG